MNRFIYFVVLHGFANFCNGLFTKPIVTIPRVCEPNCISKLMSSVVKVMKIDELVHSFCFELIFCVNPKYFLKTSDRCTVGYDIDLGDARLCGTYLISDGDSIYVLRPVDFDEEIVESDDYEDNYNVDETFRANCLCLLV